MKNQQKQKNRSFQLVFGTVLTITILSGGTSLCLASQENLTQPQQRILENYIATWQTGCGAIFGLLGSKATDLLDSKDDNSAS
ncbi:MAG: hypothetical protein QNJ47_21650 [Nostocaceae cyanobacterium]|nr:hypothetical protein [Nostocaceae cyanobacterium]